MFPIHINDGKSKAPADRIHYIVAQNGIFVRKSNWWMNATVPVKSIGFLQPQATECQLSIPPVSSVVLAKSVKFFRKVCEVHQAESMVYLHFSPEPEKGWTLSVPKQKVSPLRVTAEGIEPIDGYHCMGTIHSHPNMSAFHSGVDIKDESEFDGIHITVGFFNRRKHITIEPEAVINGSRFKLGLEYLEGVKLCEAKERPTYMMRLLNGIRSTELYSIDCQEVVGWRVPDGWMEKVQQEVPFYQKGFVPKNGQLPAWRSGKIALAKNQPPLETLA